MVEADEQLGDDEAALRKPGAVFGQGHGRLEPRDDVVADVADDRLPERLGLGEVDDPRAAADEGVAPEATALDRLEQERGTGALAQAEVRPERGEQVGCDLGGHHGHEKGSEEEPMPRPPVWQLQPSTECPAFVSASTERRRSGSRTSR